MLKFTLKIEGAKPTGSFKQVISPFNGTPVGETESPDDSGIEQAFINAEKSFKQQMSKMPAWKRAEILYKTADQMKHNVEYLSMLIAQEGGKPYRDAKVEVLRAINTVKMSGDYALNLNGEQITMDRSAAGENHIAFTIRQPMGPVFAISAFNHPVNLICHQVATAIAAGSSVVLKPASTTPLCALTMTEYFLEAGLPPEALSTLIIPGSRTDALVSDKRIRSLSFIGSGAVGWSIKRKIHDGVKIALEHGGTAAAVVDESANLERSVPNIVKAGYYHAGQVCVSTQNIFIHENIYDKFKEMILADVKKLVTGDPMMEATDVGPIITEAETDRVMDWMQSSISQGAKVILGGKRIAKQLIEPTIFENVNMGMKVMNSELFGPAVNLIRYSDIEKVTEEINSTPYSFQTAIYSQDIDVAMKYARFVESKAVIINNSTAFRVDWMPFGGSKESGYSVGGVKYAIDDMLEDKLIVIKNNI